MTLAVKVQGNKLVDGSGNPLQLRGVNISALEFVAIDGASATVQSGFDYWDGQKPNISAIKAWSANAIRIPLNEQSYLGQTCVDQTGAKLLADPGGQYRAVVKALVDEATAAGLYVILDLHKNSADVTINGAKVHVLSNTSGQSEMADADNSPAFWTAVATDYKSYPNVLFDLFNEPHMDNISAGPTYAPNPGSPAVPSDLPAVFEQEWGALRDGGNGRLIYANNQTYSQAYQSAGMQSLVNAVRATGATNVVMVAGRSWAQDLSLWLNYVPTDPLGQLAASWHAYPSAQDPTLPSFPPGSLFGTQGSYDWAEAILAAGYPIIIGETGNGSSTALFKGLLPWADAHNVSVLTWSWDVGWGSLISDANGTPIADGLVFKPWLLSHTTSGGTPVSQTQNAQMQISYANVAGFPAGSVVDHIAVTVTGSASGNTTPRSQNVTPGTTQAVFNNLPPDTYTYSVQAMPATGGGFGTPVTGSFTITAVQQTVSLSLPSAVAVSQP